MIRYIRKMMYGIQSSYTNISEDEYDKNYRKNWWLDANEIIEKGVADHIITDIEELF